MVKRVLIFTQERSFIRLFSVRYIVSSQYVKPLFRELKKEIKVRTAIREMDKTI